MPKSKISPADLIERQTPRGLVTNARGFFDAAALIASTVGLDAGGAHLRKPGFHHPFYYLAVHSIELSMKAILLASGRSHADLKKIGHDLALAYEEAARLISDSSDTDMLNTYRGDIDLISPYYEEKTFEYLVTGYSAVPPANIILECARKSVGLADRFVRARKL